MPRERMDGSIELSRREAESLLEAGKVVYWVRLHADHIECPHWMLFQLERLLRNPQITIGPGLGEPPGCVGSMSLQDLIDRDPAEPDEDGEADWSDED